MSNPNSNRFCFCDETVLSIVHMKPAATPRIIARSDHKVSRSMISPNALKVLYRLRDNGHIAYLVGGCVRDLLLGREPKDFDVATDATPGRIKKLFRNCRLVGRRFRLAHLHFRDEIIEVATFRASAPEEDGPAAGAPDDGVRLGQPRHVVSEEGVVLRDNVFGTPAEDALRRDFTVNALAYDIADFSIKDYAGGMEDLERGVIRTIGDPWLRFTEDPVRMLRAIRFAALLGFTIEDATWRAVTEQASAITLSSPPRLYEEILKLFLSGEGERCYHLLRRSGIFTYLFPGLSDWVDRESEGFPHVRTGRCLEWIDERVVSGRQIAPPLLMALLFGGYLEERAAVLRQDGRSPVEALNEAVAAFLAEQVPLVAIPHRVGLGIREILSLQQRFGKIPGKRPQTVLSRPGFSDAMNYLRCQCAVNDGPGDVLEWWESFARDKVLPPVKAAGEAPRIRRPRRRRGRGKRSAGTS